MKQLLLVFLTVTAGGCSTYWPVVREIPREHRYATEKDATDDSKMGNYSPKTIHHLPAPLTLTQAKDRLQRYSGAYLDISNAIKNNDLKLADTIAASVFGGAISLLAKSDHGLNFFALLGGSATTVSTRYKLEEQTRAYKAASDAMNCMRDSVLLINEDHFKQIKLKGPNAMTMLETVVLINDKIQDTIRKLHSTITDLRPVVPDRQGIIDSMRQMADRTKPANKSQTDTVAGQTPSSASDKTVKLTAIGVSTQQEEALAEAVDRLKPALEKCISENM